jgi:hypothetical protein
VTALRVPRALATLADGSRAVRLAAVLLAGLCAAFLVESVAHAVLPASTERSVIVASGVERGTGYRDTDRFTIAALLDSGQAVDLADRNAEGVLAAVSPGMPVLVTRSHADGQVLGVRVPEGYVDTDGFAGAWFLRVLAAAGLVEGLALGLRDRRRERWWIVAAAVVSAGITSAWLWTGPGLPNLSSPPDGMGTFGDRLPRVTALGEPARVQGVTVTVLGTPTPGLPPGADPALAGFATLTVPLSTRTETARYVPMELVGDGAGRADLLAGYPVPACGGASGALGDEVPAGGAELVLCAVVPTGFEPRYLVLGTAGPEQTALALR